MQRSPRRMESNETMKRIEEQVASVIGEVFKNEQDDDNSNSNSNGHLFKKKLTLQNSFKPELKVFPSQENIYSEEFFPNSNSNNLEPPKSPPQIFINSQLYVNNNLNTPMTLSDNINKKFLHSASMNPKLGNFRSEKKSASNKVNEISNVNQMIPSILPPEFLNVSPVLGNMNMNPNLMYRNCLSNSNQPEFFCGRESEPTVNSFNQILSNVNSSPTMEAMNSIRRSKEDIPPLFSLNEFDEILEKNVRPREKLEMSDFDMLKGNFLKIITSQNGSRVLQKALKNTDPFCIAHIFQEIYKELPRLMVDSYANYFCQKFFGFLTADDRKLFLNSIKNSTVDIGNSKIGTYPLQAVIEQLKTNEEKSIIINSVKDHVIDLCQDPQGVHVIEKMIICYDEDLIKDIYTDIIDNYNLLANNPNGLCVCKKLILHGQHIETLKKIRKQLEENAFILIQNPYGNYAIQVAFDNWSGDFCFPIMEQLVGKFYNLSMQKYSSNVVEKCLEKSDENLLSKFIDEISQHTRVIDLMKNSYGNYVVQKALKLSTGNNKMKFINCIKKNLDKLTDKKMINKWKTILNNSLYLNLGILGNPNLDNSGLNSSNSSQKSHHSNKSAGGMYSNMMMPSCQTVPPEINFQMMLNNQKGHPKSIGGSPMGGSPLARSISYNPNFQPQMMANLFSLNFHNFNK